MNNEELYNSWKLQKSPVEIQQDFPEKVKNRIHQYEQSKDSSSFGSMRLVDLISAHPLAKVALIVLGAVTGLVRLTLMIVAILNGGTVNG